MTQEGGFALFSEGWTADPALGEETVGSMADLRTVPKRQMLKTRMRCLRCRHHSFGDVLRLQRRRTGLAAGLQPVDSSDDRNTFPKPTRASTIVNVGGIELGPGD